MKLKKSQILGSVNFRLKNYVEGFLHLNALRVLCLTYNKYAK